MKKTKDNLKKAQTEREAFLSDRLTATEAQLAKTKADLVVATEALQKIKTWSYLMPPQFRSNIPAFDFIWLRDVVAAGLYGAVQRD